MKTNRANKLLIVDRTLFYSLTLAVLGVAATFSDAQAVIRNRYSFNEGATADASGRVIVDSVGGQNGIVIGTGSTATVGTLSLPGGTQPVGVTPPAYVDLPNGLVSSLTGDATFEAWFTVNAATNWPHLFDFGDQLSSGIYQEVFGPIPPGTVGASAGDAFFFAPLRSTNPNQQRFSFENDNPVGGGVTSSGANSIDSNVTLVIGVEHHVVVTYVHDDDGAGPLTNSRETLYLDGVQAGTVLNFNINNFHLSNLNDVNNWLGRSNYQGDQLLNGSLNEFRIYDHVLNPNQVAASFQRGPNAIPEPATSLLLIAGLFITAVRRNVLGRKPV